MSRYYIEDDLCFYTEGTPCSINVDGHTPTPTGVLNKDGKMIYRQPRPIGFGRDDND